MLCEAVDVRVWSPCISEARRCHVIYLVLSLAACRAIIPGRAVHFFSRKPSLEIRRSMSICGISAQLTGLGVLTSLLAWPIHCGALFMRAALER
ncbi:hypothetical protein BD414DRAFT_11051 [Trametes punicea]|nr:hypothetical protein BD414DRAFT_11051 [Trametes punicea]